MSDFERWKEGRKMQRIRDQVCSPPPASSGLFALLKPCFWKMFEVEEEGFLLERFSEMFLPERSRGLERKSPLFQLRMKVYIGKITYGLI